MGLLIDTSVLVHIERSGQAPESLLDTIGDSPGFIAAISASELLHGIHRANSEKRRKKRERFVETAFQILPVLPFDLDAARVHSRLWADLQSRGKMIGANDLLIAATALVHGHSVVTGNVREFGRIENLDVVIWSTV